MLLDRYRLVDIARKVVGVGSVGHAVVDAAHARGRRATRCSCRRRRPARRCWRPSSGASEFDNGGQRVVVGQRLMQAVSDIFLGWVRVDGHRRAAARLLPAAAPRLEGLGGDRDHGAGGDAAPTASCAGGRWPGRTPGAGTGSRSRPTSAAAPPSTSPSSEFAEAYADQNERDHQVAGGRDRVRPDRRRDRGVGPVR